MQEYFLYTRLRNLINYLFPVTGHETDGFLIWYIKKEGIIYIMTQRYKKPCLWTHCLLFLSEKTSNQI